MKLLEKIMLFEAQKISEEKSRKRMLKFIHERLRENGIKSSSTNS